MLFHREMYVVTRAGNATPLFETLRHHEAQDWASIWNNRHANDPVRVRPAAATIEYDATDVSVVSS